MERHPVHRPVDGHRIDRRLEHIVGVTLRILHLGRPPVAGELAGPDDVHITDVEIPRLGDELVDVVLPRRGGISR
ncbi:hypothetical protein ACFQH2_00805 [Natronoarchaeum sp. GCM10025703]